MSKHSDSLSHDEETDAEPVTLRGVEACKRFENFRLMLIGNTNPRVENVDAHAILKMTATQKDPSTRFCVFYRIADQIAKNSTE